MSGWVKASLLVCTLIMAYTLWFKANGYIVAASMFWAVIVLFATVIEEQLINPLWRNK